MQKSYEGIHERGQAMVKLLDLIIGATALRLDVPLVMHNVANFRNIPGLR